MFLWILCFCDNFSFTYVSNFYQNSKCGSIVECSKYQKKKYGMLKYFIISFKLKYIAHTMRTEERKANRLTIMLSKETLQVAKPT